jgi:lipoyl(octanoyl) transferase
MTPTPDPPPIEVYLLGLVDFDDVQRLQRRLVYDLGERDRGGAALVLCEHPPTISVGRSGSRLHIAPDDETLAALGVRVRWVNRGGGCVLHLPGQLAAYATVSLERLGLNLKQYLDGLHATVIGVLEDFDLKGTARAEMPGVFLGPARVATVGVAVNRWIAYHGLTLNVGPFLEPFELLLDEPGFGPGAHPLRQTSIEARRQRVTAMPRVRESFLRRFESVFGLARHHVYTNHPLIRREALPHVFAPSPG